jgi:hypothetical protein
MLNADPSKVSLRAKKRGLPQVDLLTHERFPVVFPLCINKDFVLPSSWVLLEQETIMRKFK